MLTPTRRKNRHDKDRMIYLTKREIEKEFQTPRFAKGGQGLWYLASRGNHRRSNRYDGGPTGKLAQRFWLAAVSQSLPPQRAHWHFAGKAALNQLRTQRLAEGGYTDAVDDALTRLLHAHTPLLLW